ncbi:hypothetical protein AMS68_005184 [Peltaster fructicola]|uniref:Uncharacterized protein n=1 Tax=Peltaster fructicola TaxID=286661 RepID=A0A6H0XY13_9PEZI|nr:hypothetical protein AMS68_005184 [Peltaster fructicola]
MTDKTIPQLSQRDITFISVAFQCMEGTPAINYDKFAKLTGLKGAKSARDSFHPLLKKLKAMGSVADDADGEVGITEGTTPVKPAKKTPTRKRKATTTDEGSPKTKKAAKGKKKGKASPVEDAEAEGVATDDSPTKSEVQDEADGTTPDDAVKADGENGDASEE